jgi:hypothetical protein
MGDQPLTGSSDTIPVDKRIMSIRRSLYYSCERVEASKLSEAPVSVGVWAREPIESADPQHVSTHLLKSSRRSARTSVTRSLQPN